MSMSPLDERELILPLFSGIGEQPAWDLFLRRLLARTAAQRVSLFITTAPPARRVLIERVVFAPGAQVRESIDMGAFADSILLAYGAPRPNRVYSLDELLIRDQTAAAGQQRVALERAEISHARFIRIPAAGDHSIWLFLMHDRQDFRAADSALLSALAPHVAAAFSLLREMEMLRLRAAMAEEALELIGVGQAAFDAEGRVIEADALATAELDLQPGDRPRLRAREAGLLNEACAALVDDPAGTRRVIRIDSRQLGDMLLRPVPALADVLPIGAAAIGLLRRPRHGNEAAAAQVIAGTLGLSAREAALAEGLSRGRSIVEAGARLQLTPETARNYSKRIYAKTGASGQADLVRRLLTGLAPFS